MSGGVPIEIEEKDEIYRKHFVKMQAEVFKSLVSDEVIEEHKKTPLGQHSETLESLLLYFRHARTENKYAIKSDELSTTFKIVECTGMRKLSPHVVEDKEYETIEAACHGIFLKNVQTLMNS
jgi:branched-chain amino acid transport system permease protein